MKIEFSILSYYPMSTVEEIKIEFIHVGILFHNISTGEKRLEITKNWKRVESFDDELNINLFKAILNGMKNKVEKLSDFQIEKYKKKYINELKFSEVVEIDSENFENFIYETKNVFLRYDFEKSNRISSKKQLSYIKKMFKTINVKFEKPTILGSFKEKVHYDYYIDKVGFKIFTFSHKDLNRLIASAKAWSFTANEMQEMFGIQTIFVYDSEIDNENFKVIYSILEKNGFKVINASEAIGYIKNQHEKKINLINDKII